MCPMQNTKQTARVGFTPQGPRSILRFTHQKKNVGETALAEQDSLSLAVRACNCRRRCAGRRGWPCTLGRQGGGARREESERETRGWSMRAPAPREQFWLDWPLAHAGP